MVAPALHVRSEDAARAASDLRNVIGSVVSLAGGCLIRDGERSPRFEPKESQYLLEILGERLEAHDEFESATWRALAVVSHRMRYSRLGSHRWRIEQLGTAVPAADPVELDVDEHGVPVDWEGGFHHVR